MRRWPNALGLLLVVAACDQAPAQPSSPVAIPAGAPVPEVALVRKLRPDGAGNAAAHGGVLTLENGCLFIAGPDGSRTLPLWPSDVRLERSSDGELRVIAGPDNPSQTVRVGEPIFVGGSQIGRSDQVGPGRAYPATAAYPPGCTGPVWNVYGLGPGPLDTPVPQGGWLSAETPAGPSAAWPSGEPRLVLTCDRARRQVLLTRPPSPPDPALPAGLCPTRTAKPLDFTRLTSGPLWASFPAERGEGCDGVVARAPVGHPVLDGLVKAGGTVRVDDGLVNAPPPAGEALARVLGACRAPEPATAP